MVRIFWIKKTEFYFNTTSSDMVEYFIQAAESSTPFFFYQYIKNQEFIVP